MYNFQSVELIILFSTAPKDALKPDNLSIAASMVTNEEVAPINVVTLTPPAPAVPTAL